MTEKCRHRFAAALLILVTAAAPATAGEWQSLFDGRSLDGWKSYQPGPIGDEWVAENGTLHLTRGGGGDIITEDTWKNFELEFEWQISPGGNSGVMYRVRTGDKRPYFSGPEYQLLDDSTLGKGGNQKHSTGALYALVAPENKTLNPPGEWNAGKIVLRDNHLEHWVNGAKVVETTIGDDNWAAMVADSKFRQWPQFGTTDEGHVCLQDHGNEVRFRNLRIRSLD